MEGIYESIKEILSKHPYSEIKLKNLTINGEKIYSIGILQWGDSRPDEIVTHDYAGNSEPIDGHSDAILNRILKSVKQSDKALATNSKPKLNPKIDFTLNETGNCSQYSFNDFNQQDHLLENNDNWSDQKLMKLLQKLIIIKIIKPKRCKGIIRDNEEGTIFLRFRYYSKQSNLLENKIHRRTLTFNEWNQIY